MYGLAIATLPEAESEVQETNPGNSATRRLEEKHKKCGKSYGATSKNSLGWGTGPPVLYSSYPCPRKRAGGQE